MRHRAITFSIVLATGLFLCIGGAGCDEGPAGPTVGAGQHGIVNDQATPPVAPLLKVDVGNRLTTPERAVELPELNFEEPVLIIDGAPPKQGVADPFEVADDFEPVA